MEWIGMKGLDICHDGFRVEQRTIMRNDEHLPSSKQCLVVEQGNMLHVKWSKTCCQRIALFVAQYACSGMSVGDSIPNRNRILSQHKIVIQSASSSKPCFTESIQ